MQNGKDILQGNLDVITKNVYSYVEPNQPFANHHWLYGVFAYVLHQGAGYSGMVIFKVLFILLTFVLLFYLGIKRSDFWLVTVVSIPTIFILINRSALRPEIFSYFFAVVFLYFLLRAQENPRSNKLFWLIPLQVVWVNTHLFFGTGVVMVAGFLVEKMIVDFKNVRNNMLIKKLGLVLIGLLGAIFLNPYGLQGAVYSFWVNSYKDFPIHSAEINSILNVMRSEPSWDNLSTKFFLPLVFILGASFILALAYRYKRKLPLLSHNIIFYALASIGSTGLTFFVIRSLPFFGIIFLLAMVNNLQDVFSELKEMIRKKSGKAFNVTGGVFVATLAVTLIGLAVFGQQTVMKRSEQGLGLTKFSESAVGFFKDNNLKGPIFNDTDIGSYLIGQLYPQEKVFADNRFGDAYSASFFKDTYLPMVQDEQIWKEAVEKYKFNVLFFYQYDAVDGVRDFLYRRLYDPEWPLVYIDDNVVILVKNNDENQEVIKKYQITADNLVQKMQYLIDSGNEIAVADFYNLIGRFDLSMPLYLKIVSENPEMGKVWMVLGRNELTKLDPRDSDPYLAAVFLERAIATGWKTWESYSYLALAYFRTGQLERTKWAVAQELKIDPQNIDGKKWLGLIADEEYRRSEKK